MWICTSLGFISVVADRNDATRLLVRARRKRDLVNAVGPGVDIVETRDNADYRWRTVLNRETFKRLILAHIDTLRYENFKASVKDDDLHDLYMEFWELHRAYQESDPSNGSPD